jgi:hypothetical protein
MLDLFRARCALGLIGGLMLACASHSASAQATRTWVSGVGDDVNPCSRTAPCKTFAGAISKTATGGEINALDGGGFGAVTITKSMTIDGRAAMASILGAGTNGINVNLTSSPTDPSPKVIIRNIDINGVGTGIKGINFIGAGRLHLENVRIYGFSQQGIYFAPNVYAAAADLTLNDVSVRENAQAGVLVTTVSPNMAFVTIRNSSLENNGLKGIRVLDGSFVSIVDSTISNNGIGIEANGLSRSTSLILDGATVVGNGQQGVLAVGGLAVVRATNSTISHNNVAVQSSGGGQIFSYRNNRLDGNIAGIGTTPTQAVLQ